MPPNDNNDAPNGRGSDNRAPDGQLDRRLDALKQKLDDANARSEAASGNDPDSEQNAATRSGVAQAFRLSSEFIAGIVVGGGIGYLVDSFFDSSPWGFIVFFLLGFATAILNVLRAAGMVAESQMRLKPAQELHKRSQDGDSDGAAKK